MRYKEFLKEDDFAKTKQEIITRLNSLSNNPENPEEQKEAEEVLDKIYSLLNRRQTYDKFEAIVAKELNAEYGQTDNKALKRRMDQKILQIAGKISEAPLTYKDKMKFAENLSNGKVINPNLLLKAGQYTLEELCYNQPENLVVFDHLKGYGVGEQMKGPGEHALAILSPDISLKATGGDVSVKGRPVEVKASVSGGGGGRFGETSMVPTRDSLYKIITSYPELKEPIEEVMKKQKSLNIKNFTEIVNQTDMDPRQRKDLGTKLFTALFGKEAGILVNTFSGAGVDPQQVADAYTVANFDHYKASGEGGAWETLVGINFGANTMATVKSGQDVLKIRRKTSTPAVLTTGKPNENLYQFTPV